MFIYVEDGFDVEVDDFVIDFFDYDILSVGSCCEVL